MYILLLILLLIAFFCSFLPASYLAPNAMFIIREISVTLSYFFLAYFSPLF